MSQRDHDRVMMEIAGEVQWRLPPTVFPSAISHGNRLNAEKLRRMGQLPGIYDWLISAPLLRGWIEIKTGTGALRHDQIVFRDTVRANGEKAEVAHSCAEFFDHLRSWGISVADERPIDEWNDEVPTW